MSNQCCGSHKTKKHAIQHNTQQSKKKNNSSKLIILTVIVVTIVAVFALSKKNSYGTSQEIKPANGIVKIPVAQVQDGKAHFFHYSNHGKDIRFFVLRSSDGVLRAAFDTCDVCYQERKGYRQVGDAMVCNNCETAFPSVYINVRKGGCNPVPLARTVDGNDLIITVPDILQGAYYFS